MTLKTFVLVSAALVLAAGSFAGGAGWTHRHGVPAPQTKARSIIAYACPMHPEYRSDPADGTDVVPLRTSSRRMPQVGQSPG